MFSFDADLIFSTAGLMGVALYIMSYLGLQTGQLRGGTVLHTTLNLVAAACVLMSLSQNFNLSAAMVQFIWIAISIFGLGRIYYLHRTTQFTKEEEEFISKKLPQMSRPMARSFLNAGHWVNAEPGACLAVENERLGSLIYLAEGEVQVMSDGIEIAVCKAGHFIGEVTFLNEDCATATVIVKKPARYFIVTRAALQNRLKRDADFRLSLEQALSVDSRTKLIAANAKYRAVSEAQARPST